MSNFAFGGDKRAYPQPVNPSAPIPATVVNHGEMVISAIRHFVNLPDDDDRGNSKLLWVSDMGQCPRRSILRVTDHEETIPFDTEAKIRFLGGNIYEDSTAACLKSLYGKDNVIRELHLGNQYWSGYADFVIGHGTLSPVIIEHKATGDRWWNYTNNIPRHPHVAQLWMYGQLYYEAFHILPKLILFYRAWGHYAEIEITEIPGAEACLAKGTIDGAPIEKTISPHPMIYQAQLEQSFAARDTELPQRLDDMQAGCVFRGEPSCLMYHHCWGEEEGEDAVAKTAV